MPALISWRIDALQLPVHNQTTKKLSGNSSLFNILKWQVTEYALNIAERVLILIPVVYSYLQTSHHKITHSLRTVCHRYRPFSPLCPC